MVIAVLTVLFLFSRRSAVCTAASSGSRTPTWSLPYSCCYSCSFWVQRSSSWTPSFKSIGGYLANIIPMSFRTSPLDGDSAFVSGWTVFYWAWWISWAPFVGTFIARISRGRTIREFVFGVILAPSVVSFIWFAILGGTAINLQLSGAANIAETAANNQPAALFLTPGAVPAVLADGRHNDHPGSAVLRQRGRRGLDGDGDALLEGQPASAGRGTSSSGASSPGRRRRSACWPARFRARWTPRS